jgi:hypothetical protein
VTRSDSLAQPPPQHGDQQTNKRGSTTNAQKELLFFSHPNHSVASTQIVEELEHEHELDVGVDDTPTSQSVNKAGHAKIKP